MAFFALDRCYRSVTRVLLPEYTPSRFPRRAFLATGRKWKTSTHPWRWPCWAFSNRVRESAPPSATSSSKRSTGTSSARCRAPHGGAKCAALLRSGSGVCIWHRSCPAEGNSFNPHTNAQRPPRGFAFPVSSPPGRLWIDTAQLYSTNRKPSLPSLEPMRFPLRSSSQAATLRLCYPARISRSARL